MRRWLGIKGLWCRVVGHDDVRVIDGLTPEHSQRVYDDRVSLAARVESSHLWCWRCHRRTRGPSEPSLVSRLR